MKLLWGQAFSLPAAFSGGVLLPALALGRNRNSHVTAQPHDHQHGGIIRASALLACS